MKFRVLEEIDIEAFNTAVRKAGYTPDDFVLVEKEDPRPTVGVSAVTGTATVRYVKTGIEWPYPVGHSIGEAWAADVAQDLRAGFFNIDFSHAGRKFRLLVEEPNMQHPEELRVDSGRSKRTGR